MSYACLYKAGTGAVDEILDTDITITLIREKRPAKLLKQLSEKYHVISKGNGIYHIEKMLFPMQIVVTGEFVENPHFWLKALTRMLAEAEGESCAQNMDLHFRERNARTAGKVL